MVFLILSQTMHLYFYFIVSPYFFVLYILAFQGATQFFLKQMTHLFISVSETQLTCHPIKNTLQITSSLAFFFFSSEIDESENRKESERENFSKSNLFDKIKIK